MVENLDQSHADFISRQCCRHATLGSLPEAEKPFPHFETLDLELPYAD